MVDDFRHEIRDLSRAIQKLARFNVDFIDETGFQSFIRELPKTLRDYDNFCMAGYFSEAFVQPLIKQRKGLRARIRVLSPELNLKQRRDRNNLKALRKLQDEDIEVKIHSRLHCRMLLAYSHRDIGGIPEAYGHVILGTFDYNDEGVNASKRNAGIKTMNPDLLKSAIKYYDELWEEFRDTKSLDEMYPE